MTFGDMVRKKENIIVKASDLEAEVANDSCQSYENNSTETLIEVRGSMETSSTSSVVASSTSTVEAGSPLLAV